MKTFADLKRQYPYIAKTFERGKFFDDKTIHFNERGGFYLLTKSYKYEITCEPGYLGCIAGTKRKTWKGNDLADGKNNEKTWQDIVSDIISYELV